MFRKLTTLIDCKLAREIEKDHESALCSSEGFRVCMELASWVVYPALNHTLERCVATDHQLGEAERFPFENGKIIQNFLSGEGHCIRGFAHDSHRMEIAIGIHPNLGGQSGMSFSWLLLFFRKSEKEAFYSVTINVSQAGQILGKPHLMNWR